MKIRRLFLEPCELVATTVDPDPTEDGTYFATFADGSAYTVLDEDQALTIAESWRSVEQKILERRYGVQAVA